MNKKIASEIAIGIIILLAIIIGSVFWINNARQIGKNQNLADNISLNENNQEKSADTLYGDDSGENCTPHYYEGKADIQGWVVSADEKEMIIQLKKDEEKKLPTKKKLENSDFKVRLVDSTDVIKKELFLATKEAPASLTVQGYAEVCAEPPLVSLKQATDAFKKS